MTSGNSNVVVEKGTLRLSPKAKPFTLKVECTSGMQAMSWRTSSSPSTSDTNSTGDTSRSSSTTWSPSTTKTNTFRSGSHSSSRNYQCYPRNSPAQGAVASNTNKGSAHNSMRGTTDRDVWAQRRRIHAPVLRPEQTEEYHMVASYVKLAPRPPPSAAKGPEFQERKPETYTISKPLPNHHEDERVLTLERELEQTRENLLKAKARLNDAGIQGYVKELEEQLIESRYELLLQKAQFEATELLRPRTEVEALLEERAALVDKNRSQASHIKELTSKVAHLTIRPEQLQNAYERYVENYQVKLDRAETKATRLEKELKEIQKQRSSLAGDWRARRQ